MASGSGFPGGSRQSGSTALTLGGARQERPVSDPQLPHAFRLWVAGQRPVFSPDGKLAVLTPGGSSGGRGSAAACWLLAALCVILMFPAPLSAGRPEWLAAAAVLAVTALVVQRRSSRRDLRLCRTRVIFPESLDATCRALLRRGQSAINTIARSEVRAAGLLGNPIDDATLRQHEWEIAVKLREITSLRAMLANITSGTPSGPLTSRVLGGQQRAIELAQHATTARVAALESYASQIRAADDAERDWQQATKLSRLNDTYMDLVASTAVDDWAAREMATLTEQLTAAAQARSDRLHDADLASMVLVLPRAQPEP